jgi:hypothetical protein
MNDITLHCAKSSIHGQNHSLASFISFCRGVTEIKGKGKMPTYWLLGKEGFDKELPRPPPLK